MNREIIKSNGGRLAEEAAALSVSTGVSAEALITLWRWLSAGGYNPEQWQYFQAIRERGETTPETVERILMGTPGLHAAKLPEYRIPLDGDYVYEVQMVRELANAMERLSAAALQERTEGDTWRTLHIDVETYSGADIKKCGAYKYVESDDFELLLIAYSVNRGAVQQVDLRSGEKIPAALMEALTDPAAEKHAFNAAFEHAVLERWTGKELPWEQWHCTMHLAARCGYPQSLSTCGAALGIDRQKLDTGRSLILKFCTPTGRKRLKESPGDWEEFKRYNRRDVEAELDIEARLAGRVNVPAWERLVELADWRINARGALADTELAEQAARLFAEEQERTRQKLKDVTGLDNPGSAAQMRAWLSDKTGKTVESVGKKATDGLAGADGDVAEALRLRAQLCKTSCSKYAAVLDAACKDGRVRGLTQYYGAARTGRWAGRLVQTQNLPQNHIPDLGYARELVKAGDAETLRFDFDAVTPVLSELVRTVFVAPAGMELRVADFSAIEARVVAWLAGERWALDVFRGSGRIYEATAAKMFHVAESAITHGDPRRQKGKIAVLALGYGGGVGALKAMGGEKMGLSEHEMEDTVKGWRAANPHIVRLWSDLEIAARRTVITGGSTNTHGVTFERRGDDTAVVLPSGRELIYPEMGVDGRTHRLVYMGTNQTTRRWELIDTYGGKLTENIVQAIARDCLATVLVRLERAGYLVVFHVHDEAVCECDAAHTLDGMLKIFNRPPKWAEGLPLRAEGYSTKFYKKA